MLKPTFIYYVKNGSIYSKMGFLLKFLFFLTISTFALMSTLWTINLIGVLLVSILIISTRFPKNNNKPFKALIFAIMIFSVFWIFTSRIPGDIIVRFPWGTYISYNTVNMMLLAITRWSMVVLSGIHFMIMTSEEDVINFLIRIHMPQKLILMLTIAFNTIGFTIRDLETVDYALSSRNFNDKGLINKIRKAYHIGVVIFLSNLKKIDTLNQSYVLRENDKIFHGYEHVRDKY